MSTRGPATWSKVQRIACIDPALTATGCGLVHVRVDVPGRWPEARHVAVVEHVTVKTSTRRDLVQRLAMLRDDVQRWLGRVAHLADVVVIEDPTDFTAYGRRSTPQSIGTLGAAYGTVLVAVGEYARRHELPLATYGTKEWLPKTRNKRGGLHTMKHEDHIAQLTGMYHQLRDLTDHEQMAVGLALHHAALKTRRYVIWKT